MPELPEVETIRRQLAPHVKGRTITAVEVPDPLWAEPRDPADLAAALCGARIERLGRRGKYFVTELTAEGAERFLVMHLRMTGNLLYVSEGDDQPGRHRHLRARLVLDDGNRLLFTDMRRFGRGLVLEGRDELEAYFAARLGPEPLDPAFGPTGLAEQAAGRAQPVKAFLLTQARLAGVGNIYADEALFRAQIHPEQPAGTLKPEELERLHQALVASLEAGVDARGASIDDYRDSEGARGTMQDEFLVHRREGIPCPRCGTPIKKRRSAGRGTYYCASCQRLRRRKLRRARAART